MLAHLSCEHFRKGHSHIFRKAWCLSVRSEAAAAVLSLWGRPAWGWTFQRGYIQSIETARNTILNFLTDTGSNQPWIPPHFFWPSSYKSQEIPLLSELFRVGFSIAWPWTALTPSRLLSWKRNGPHWPLRTFHISTHFTGKRNIPITHTSAQHTS